MDNNRLLKDQISYIHLSDPDEPQDFLMLPAYVISETQAYVISDNHLELHVISPTEKPNVFTTVSCADPLFYVGNDEQAVFYDLTTMTFVEFAREYMHATLHEKCRHPLIESRWKKQLTAEETAHHVQMTLHDYLRIEHGVLSPSVEVAYRLSKRFDTSIEKLFFQR